VMTALPLREPVRAKVMLTVHYRVGKQAPSKVTAEFGMQLTSMPPLPGPHALQPTRLELQQPVINLTITGEISPGEDVKPQIVELVTYYLPESQQPAIKFRVHPQGSGPLTKELQRLATPFELIRTDGEVKHWIAYLPQQFNPAAVVELRKQT